MAKNQHSRNSSGEYKEIYIATAHSLMASAPVPKQTFTISATTAHAFRLRAAARQLPSSGEVIPVEIDPHLLPKERSFSNKSRANYVDPARKSTNELTKVSSKMRPDAALSSVRVQHQEKESMNDKFTEYINRVKHGMLRTLSDVEDNEVCINDNS